MVLHQALQTPGVYEGDVNVVLLMPVGAKTDNALAARPAALADFAGIVARSVAGRGGGEISVSDEVTLAAQGVRHGWSVRQPSSGGQWNYSFDQPVVEVRATGPTEAAVVAQLTEVIARIRADIARRESVAGARADQRVRLTLSPSTPIVLYGGGDRRRATLAGTVACTAAAATVLAWPSRRGRRPAWGTMSGRHVHRTTAGDQA